MAEIVAFSDLHLGDREEENGTVLTSLSACKNFASQLADVTGGHIGTLVGDGDIFEACVPTRTLEENYLHKTSVFDLYNSTVEDAQKFFSALTAKIKIDRFVFVPGNHDYSIYARMRSIGMIKNFVGVNPKSHYTPPTGATIRLNGTWINGAEYFGRLIGNRIDNVVVATPNYIYSKPSIDWPIAVFTHGHLFDQQVLAPSKELLAAVGLLAETGKIFQPIPKEFDVNSGHWMEKLAELTHDRVSSIWTQNLDLAKEAVYNYVERRKIHIICEEKPKTLGTHVWLAAIDGLNVSDELKWYLDGLIYDLSPVLPNPRPVSYFVKGHTHFGGAKRFDAMDSTPFNAYDLGGWTRDAEGHKDNVPHTHALVWDQFPADPKMYAFNVG